MGPEKAQSGRRDGISNSLIAVISFDGPKYVDIHVHVQTTDYNMRIQKMQRVKQTDKQTDIWKDRLDITKFRWGNTTLHIHLQTDSRK